MKNLVRFLMFPVVLLMCVPGTLIAFAWLVFLGLVGLARVVYDTMEDLYNGH